MNTATLPRLSFKEDLTDVRKELALAAKEKLRYHKLANTICIPGTLLNTLRELGIAPLNPNKVRDYMESKEYTGVYSGTKEFFASLASLATVLFLLVWGLHGADDSKIQWSGTHIAANTTLVFAGVVCIIWFIYCITEAKGNGNRLIREWKEFPLNTYTGTVPEFALSRAIQIAEALPAASFRVVQLVERNDYKERPLRDPFMQVWLGNESYYIDVWDEKEYENTI